VLFCAVLFCVSKGLATGRSSRSRDSTKCRKKVREAGRKILKKGQGSERAPVIVILSRGQYIKRQKRERNAAERLEIPVLNKKT
jgi:hypothetical protein